MTGSFNKKTLADLYLHQKLSVPEISKVYRRSEGGVNYWLKKYGVKKRSISEALYLRNNPDGDKFKIHLPKDSQEAMAFGVGLGLYWGEGNKANKNSIKLGNTNSLLMRTFLAFLQKFIGLKTDDLKFELHLSAGSNENKAIDFWRKALNIKTSQFYKSSIIDRGTKGTYKNKSGFGVLSVYYNNTRARNILMEWLAEIAQLAEHAHGKRKVPGSIPGLGSISLR